MEDPVYIYIWHAMRGPVTEDLLNFALFLSPVFLKYAQLTNI